MCDSPYWVPNPTPWVLINGVTRDMLPIQCGRCPPCKENKVNAWVFRLEKESERSTSVLFVTLTYDPSTVPITAKGFMTLEPKHLTDFFKRLRYYDKNNRSIKYYACGEYGSERWRPHYHLIIFNVRSRKSIERAWTDGIVDIDPDEVGGAAMAYTTKYINKPGRIPRFKGDDRTPEFSRKSKGLGSNYITEQVIAWHSADLSRNYLQRPGGHKIALPKYYRDKIFDATQKAKQRRIIDRTLEELEADKMRDFYKKYGDDADYDAYLQSEKQGRHYRFYKDQFPRKDL